MIKANSRLWTRKLFGKVPLSILASVGFILLQLAIPKIKPIPPLEERLKANTVDSPPESVRIPQELARLVSSSEKPKLRPVKPGTLPTQLKTYNIPPQLADQAVKVLNDRGARAKSAAVYTSITGELKRLEYYLKDRSKLIIFKNGKTYQLYHEPTQHYAFVQTLSGTLESSFYESAINLGLSPEVVFEITHVLQGRIDFRKDIHQSDSFSLLIEHSGIEDERLLAAQFRLNNRTIEIYAFIPQDGEEAYFTQDGKSLTTGFLTSPIAHSRITSRFSLRRLHPVLGYVRPHYGIDYAAPYGTPVMAIGPGRIVYVGYKGGFGRLVEIFHPEFVFVSQYGHLSRYAQISNVGQLVKAGDIIGYVGTSGMTTGPHVHFGITQKGKYLNPERIQFPRYVTLSRADQNRFQSYVAKLHPLFSEQKMGIVMVQLSESSG
jgi:murein DD-endopeptidase MepM/ murein hydrolase activator NlpD